MAKHCGQIYAVLVGLTLGLPCTAALAEGVSGERSVHPNIPEDTTLIGAHFGVYDVSATDTVVVGYGISADRAVGTNVLLGGTLDYWNDTAGDITEPHVAFSDLAFGMDGKYVFTDVRVPFRPYVLAGIALHRFEVTNIGYGDSSWHGLSNTATKLGVDVGGGLMYHIERHVDIGGELRWRLVTDTVANLNQLAITGSLSYAL